MGPERAFLIIGLLCSLKPCVWSVNTTCGIGKQWEGKQCVDMNECEDSDIVSICGEHAQCFNTVGSFTCRCHGGFKNVAHQVNFTVWTGRCEDINECEDKLICGRHANCTNTIGNYSCTCDPGYDLTPTRDPGYDLTPTRDTGYDLTPTRDNCTDIDECSYEDICGPEEICTNMIGTYSCTRCQTGYRSTPTDGCTDIDECDDDPTICGGETAVGRCENGAGSFVCHCSPGYSNYGNDNTPCSELKCDQFKPDSGEQSGLSEIRSLMLKNCDALSSDGTLSNRSSSDGNPMLEMFNAVGDVLGSPSSLDSGSKVTGLLTVVEDAMRLLGAQLADDQTHQLETSQTEAKLAVRKGQTPPTGLIHLTNENAALDTDWETASGNGTYPGFAVVALVSYKNLERSVNHSFDSLRGGGGGGGGEGGGEGEGRGGGGGEGGGGEGGGGLYQRDSEGPPESIQIFSKVVSAVVSNPSTEHLHTAVSLTLRHLQEREGPEARFICAYWKNVSGGSWATDGCSRLSARSNATHTVCLCHHLSSFAVLMALYPLEPALGLEVLTRLGLVLSLLCLAASIVTFWRCRSIQGTRTTIHLHLCVCLFIADLVFIAGIEKTTPEGGCRLVAALLHYFFLCSLVWMLLEGVQLYRMVVLVFNTTMRPVYLYAVGYGTPLGVVVVSAISRPTGHGTKEHCWLSLSHGFIWAFYGPVCLIMVLNVFFFMVTVWRLAQKFSSINPDLSKLRKIKAFTVTAIAQLCVLGLMWVFGFFLFSQANVAVEYMFVILNGLQGVLIFLLHCLLSKQVREEYVKFFSCIRPKKKYSDLSTTNPSSSSSHGNRSARHTGESRI